MKKRGVDSNFKVLEPVCGDLRDPKSSKFFAKSGLFSKMPSWFKSYMEFYIGTESYAMHFLKARVVVVCARGFEIINLEALNMNPAWRGFTASGHVSLQRALSAVL
ncbi:hypothetical protein G6F42_027657 [Rhizopus arrhizus]|nr:hypothetical protein G6F42_027657 [Rhizopus arrhizus]